jgi:hypothetical protein
MNIDKTLYNGRPTDTRSEVEMQIKNISLSINVCILITAA